MKTIDAMKKLSEWHSKTAKLWPTGMDQSTFHNQAAITLHDAISREEAQTVEPVGHVFFNENSDSPSMEATILRDDLVKDGDKLFTRPTPTPIGERAELIARLRNGSNWLIQGYGSFKDCVSKYDRAPFEAADMLAADSLQANESAAAERDVLQALSVTNILLEVAPGEDGGGLEIYAKSVADVEQVLTNLGVAMEDAQGEAQTLRAKLAALEGQEPVATISRIDEYGPCLDWYQHWVEHIGANLYLAAGAAQPVSAGVPEGHINVTEAMHRAAVKVLHRASGLDGLPQRMMDAMLASAPQPPAPAKTMIDEAFDAGPSSAKPLPLTEDQRETLRTKIMVELGPLARNFIDWRDWPGTWSFADVAIRVIEAAHGIKEPT